VQLSLHADYALRVLIYLGTYPDRVVSTQEISSAYGISKHHLVRVIHTLGEHRYVDIHAGRSGGVMLAREPHLIALGDVIRHAEPNLRLAECFDRESNTCPIAPQCALKGMLNEALEAFLATLNQYTIADVLRNEGRRKLASLFATFAGWSGDRKDSRTLRV
jgi:Rrf2 family transcriptional regulator, nitric oxide-sensitive transcriptional repressor